MRVRGKQPAISADPDEALDCWAECLPASAQEQLQREGMVQISRKDFEAMERRRAEIQMGLGVERGEQSGD